MTYNEKKFLYESIMKDIAKTVKRKINEADTAPIATNRPLNKLYDLITKIPLEYYYNSDNNEKFHSKFPNDIILKGDKIGFKIKIYDENDEMLGEYTMLRNSLGQALEDFAVIRMTTLIDISKNYFDFYITNVINVFYKSFDCMLSDEQSDELDNRIQKFYYSTIKGANNLDAIIKALDEMGEEEE